ARRARRRRQPGRGRARGRGDRPVVPHRDPARMSAFELQATDGAARAGRLRTAHGDLRTPAFMPVGTKATVKSVDPRELRDLGAEILLGNTYHLHFRLGTQTIAELGGLHAFMGWDGPILTDSGGFQVFSLRHTILRLDDDGVAFRSVYDGDPARLTPELAAHAQAELGSDIAMCLDVCPPADASRAQLEEAVRLTSLWAARQRDADRANGQLLFGIAQGADRDRAQLGGRPPESPQRTLRARPRSAGRGLRLPCLHPLLACLPAPPCQPAGAARAPAPDPA